MAGDEPQAVAIDLLRDVGVDVGRHPGSADLDRLGAAAEGPRPHAPAEAVACLEQDDARAALRDVACRAHAGQTAADHDHVRVERHCGEDGLTEGPARAARGSCPRRAAGRRHVERRVAVEEPDGFSMKPEPRDRHHRPVLGPQDVVMAERVPDHDVGVLDRAVGLRPTRAGRRRPGAGTGTRRPGSARRRRSGVTHRWWSMKPRARRAGGAGLRERQRVLAGHEPVGRPARPTALRLSGLTTVQQRAPRRVDVAAAPPARCRARATG